MSCSGTDPLPEPSAGFSFDKTYVEIGTTINFSNSSLNATIFEWDFGDGQVSTVQNPSILFDLEGEFIVTLISKTEDDQIAAPATGTVFVGERVTSGISFNSISFVRPDNTAWDDDGTGPDFAFFYGTSDGFQGFTDDFDAFLVAQDLTSAELPFGFDFEAANRLKLSDAEEWIVTMDEIDIPPPPDGDPDDSSTWVFENMFGVGPFNPYSFGQTDYDEGVGFLSIVTAGFSIDLFYEIVVDLDD